MTISEKEKELFDEWKLIVQGFIPDGLVDEESYLASSPKVLYLLKETNGGSDWSLKEYLISGGRSQTWTNVARWQYGLQNLNKDINWKELNNVSTEWRKVNLKSVCVVNIKKQSGSYECSYNKLISAATRDKDYLKRQIDIYNPDIIICCGTSNIYFDYIYKISSPQWKMTKHGIWYVQEYNRIVVSYLHPAARVNDALLYYGLIDAVKEICNIHKEQLYEEN